MIYSIKTSREGYRVVKFDNNYDILAIYNLRLDFDRKLTCDCPSQKKPCKHLTNLLPAFKTAKAIGGGLVLTDFGFRRNPLAHWIDWRP